MGHKQDEPDVPVLYEQGATEEQIDRIDAIVGSEVLGYDGSGQGEHSGQDSPEDAGRLSDLLADNRPDQME